MKFTLSWLKEHLETQNTLEEIVERLTAIGLEVEAVDDRSALNPFVIARVVEVQKHPNADKLRLLQVDSGDGRLIQVVCGAPNVQSGMMGVFAPSGSYIPGTGITLVTSKIREVESCGMMCSERELELSNEHDGIIELPQDAPLGARFAAWRGLDDPIIDVALTPNRPDCASVRGIARDLAASGCGRLKDLSIPDIVSHGEPEIDVQLDFDDGQPLCLGFAWRVVRGVGNCPSPAWMQQRLTAIGLRPINAAVDITNYMTHDLGRPLHVFDANKIAGHLVVRRAREGENLVALDGKTYHFGKEACVIADERNILSIAGIMGGATCGCDEQTTDILIESALWHPGNIAATGRALNIVSDARYRFERGVDPDFMLPGLDIATRLLETLTGGISSSRRVVGFKPKTSKSVLFPLSEVKRLTGLEIEAPRVCDLLQRLGFTVEEQGNNFHVCPPSWRPDIEGKADLVEEVMRLHGIDKITPQPLPQTVAIGEKILTPLQMRSKAARRCLAARGMMEAITYSFISTRAAEAFGGGAVALKLVNPIAAEMSDMRPSLLPGLMLAAQRNGDRGMGDVALFEVADCYEGDAPHQQIRMAGGIRRGSARFEGSGRFWSGHQGAVHFYDVKADVLVVLEACGLEAAKLPLEAGATSSYHPGRSATIQLGKTILARFGEIHPDILAVLDVGGPLCGFEIFLDALPEAKKKPTKTRPALNLSPYPRVKRDFAFIVDKTTVAATLVRAALGADKKLIQSVDIFDVFTDDMLGENKKSIAIEVTLLSSERTLTEEEIDAVGTKIIANVAKSTGGVLRR